MKSKEWIHTIIETNGFWVLSEIRQELNYTTELVTFDKDKITKNIIKQLLYYDEDKYPGKPKHDEYIKSEKWKIRKKGFLLWYVKYKKFLSCKVCGLSEETTKNEIAWNIHHNSYDNFAHETFTQEMPDLELLCACCHESIHALLDIFLNDQRPMFSNPIKINNFIDEWGILRFGKYKGEHVANVPEHYQDWIKETTKAQSDIDIINNLD